MVPRSWGTEPSLLSLVGGGQSTNVGKGKERGHTLEPGPGMTRAEAPPAGGQLTSKYKLRHHGASHSGALAAGQAHRGEAHRRAPAHISSGWGCCGQDHSEKHEMRNGNTFLS